MQTQGIQIELHQIHKCNNSLPTLLVDPMDNTAMTCKHKISWATPSAKFQVDWVQV